MKKRISFVLAFILAVLAFTVSANAVPVLADTVTDKVTLFAEQGGEIDLNISELFVVERGYAVPFDEEELPVEYRQFENVGIDMWHVNLYLIGKDEFVVAPVIAYEGGEELVIDGKISSV